MPRSVFLSYRREDSAGHTGRMHDRFVQRWGSDRVFLDIDNIPPGEDFVDAIDRTLNECAIVLVVIGPRWLDARDSRGGRRLDSETDFHRLEIERALQRKIRVLPVLVGGAHMPGQTDLPAGLAALARRNAFEVTDRRFNFDAGNLVDAIDKELQAIELKSRAEEERRKAEEREAEARVKADALRAEAFRLAEEARQREAEERRADERKREVVERLKARGRLKIEQAETSSPSTKGLGLPHAVAADEVRVPLSGKSEHERKRNTTSEGFGWGKDRGLDRLLAVLIAIIGIAFAISALVSVLRAN